MRNICTEGFNESHSFWNRPACWQQTAVIEQQVAKTIWEYNRKQLVRQSLANEFTSQLRSLQTQNLVLQAASKRCQRSLTIAVPSVWIQHVSDVATAEESSVSLWFAEVSTSTVIDEAIVWSWNAKLRFKLNAAWMNQYQDQNLRMHVLSSLCKWYPYLHLQ